MITIEEMAGLIRQEMRGKLPKDVQIDDSTRLDELGLSSLQVSEIVFTLEDEHGVEFDPAKAPTRRPWASCWPWATKRCWKSADRPVRHVQETKGVSPWMGASTTPSF